MDSQSSSRPRALLAAAAALCAALLFAAPAAADPLGDQFRVSDHPAGGGVFGPDIANNGTTGEHLAVWLGSNNFNKGGEPPQVFIRRIAADGTPAGGMTPIAAEPPSFAPPSVAYNRDDNEWLVVWVGGDGTIRGQRIAADGSQVGPDDFAIPDDAVSPNNADVAYSSEAREYMVGWAADGDAWVHRVGADGSDRSDDIAVEDTDGVTVRTSEPGTVSLAYNPVGRQFALVWHGSRNAPAPTGIVVPTIRQDQVYGQRIGLDGGELGDDFQVSQQDESLGASRVAGATIAANATSGDFLVTWRGEQTAGQDDGDFEVIGQRLGGDGSRLGDPFAITNDMTPVKADLAYNSNANQFVATFNARDREDLLFGGGQTDEVYAQVLGGDGGLHGDRFQLSEMGSGEEGDESFGIRPAVTYNPTTCDYASVWFGARYSSEDETDHTDQVWGRRIAAPACPQPPAVVAAPVQPAAPARPARPRVSVAGVRRSCIRRSTKVSIRIALASGVRLTSARVTLNGKRIKTSRRVRFSVTVNPKRLRAGRSYRLRIVANDSAGNRRTITRTIRVCAAQRRRATPRFTG